MTSWKRYARIVTLAGLALPVATSCNRPPAQQDDAECDPLASNCEGGLVCDPFEDGSHQCVVPVVVFGHVQRLIDGEPIEGALVQAVDINGAPLGTTAQTDAEGAYSITVPALRDEEGTPLQSVVTLQVQAAGYQQFPTAIRPALPLDLASAVSSEEDGFTLENPLTTIGLIELPGDPSLLGSISGTIEGEIAGGVLVVAEAGGMAVTGFGDVSGVFTIFNVPAGSYDVRGYAADLQVPAVQVVVGVGEAVTDVQLAVAESELSTVSGSVQIVNAPGGSVTSVILAVESTFQEATARGQVPPGLRVGGITGAFAINGVPDGRYVVLAAFENDSLVRDPDENISGTQIVHMTVPDPVTGNIITISEGFKVTEALDVVSPGADGPEQTTVPTEFVWADDSSEDGYTVKVFDAFGTLIWETEIASVSGSANVTLTYAGPELEPGMFYQFRVTSFRERSGSRSAISTTEDLKGVFFIAAEAEGNTDEP